MKNFLTNALTAVAMSLAPTGAALAQAWPAKPVRLVVPFAPGGSTDVQARLLALELQKSLGQPVVVENRPGANGNLGTAEVARAPADGYTILMGGIGPNAVSAAFTPAPRYDPAKDFIAVAMTAVSPNVLVVNPSLKADSLQQLLAEARARPGRLDYASPGAGTSNHLAMELLKHRAKVFIVTVPYKGSAPAMTDVMAGQLPMMFNNIDVVLPHIRAGKLKPLAITGARRSPLLPNVPTMAEAGMPDFAVGAWFGLFVPAGTPAPVVQRLHTETQKALATPEMRAKFEAMGIQPGTMDQPAFARFVLAEIQSWGKLVRDAGLKAE
jgi:tripartite-type tricarboxylate transporter receptor subunit TctC